MRHRDAQEVSHELIGAWTAVTQPPANERQRCPILGKRHGTHISSTFQWNQPYRRPDFGLLSSGIIREQISVVLSQHICDRQITITNKFMLLPLK